MYSIRKVTLYIQTDDERFHHVLKRLFLIFPLFNVFKSFSAAFFTSMPQTKPRNALYRAHRVVYTSECQCSAISHGL